MRGKRGGMSRTRNIRIRRKSSRGGCGKANAPARHVQRDSYPDAVVQFTAREPGGFGESAHRAARAPPTYGAGTIIGVEGEDEDRKFTVRFSDHGTKKLVERYANLTWA